MRRRVSGRLRYQPGMKRNPCSPGSGLRPPRALPGTSMLRALPPSAFFSYTVTLKPRSASSCAAVSPATPPPSTATLLPETRRRGAAVARPASAAVPATAAVPPMKPLRVLPVPSMPQIPYRR